MENWINSEDSTNQIQQVISTVENLLNHHILGIYLYGSSASKSLKPSSDIDILVMIDQEIPLSIRENLTNQLLVISGKVGCTRKRPLEVTVINQHNITPWQYPPKCDYMYGEWLRSQIENGVKIESCYDPDLTILLWQARLQSIMLKGIEIEKIIPNIPFTDIQNAIKDCLPGLIASLIGDERNVLLTLARMWFTLETQKICAKDFAGEWVYSKLPKDLQPLMKMAKEAYCGNFVDHWDDVQQDTISLANFLRDKVQEKLNCIT